MKYHEALAVSADVAQHGFNWTLDMERYCAVLKRGSGGNELLNGYIKLMRAGAKDAQRQSKALSDQFVRVSAALHHVSTSFISVTRTALIYQRILSRSQFMRDERLMHRPRTSPHRLHKSKKIHKNGMKRGIGSTILSTLAMHWPGHRLPCPPLVALPHL